ncbi:unnamed protein product, partial [Trichogramma brassicae]
MCPRIDSPRVERVYSLAARVNRHYTQALQSDSIVIRDYGEHVPDACTAELDGVD